MNRLSDEQRRAYLHAMGLQIWQCRTKDDVQSLLSDVLTDVGSELKQHEQTLQEQSITPQMQQLNQCVQQCKACSLHKTRKQAVFGTGSFNAKLMIVGEAPGAEEDRQGKPFVGRSGQLLTQMLKSIGLAREEVFIANVLKCRPPSNRDPDSEEVIKCTPYLVQQIELIQPQLLVAVGRIAAHYLLQTTTALSKLRGQVLRYAPTKTPLIVTYHPAYLLRSPKEKRKAYEDLLFIQRQLVAA